MRMRLSQSHLNLLDQCPRKFQHIFLDQYSSLVSPEQQARLNWGNQFHLLMQQRELGLPIASLYEDDSRLLQHVHALVTAAPEIFQTMPALIRQSEHRRTLEFHDYLLTVVYDLVLLGQTAQILDWKTYPKPQTRRWLEQDWQTRLYPFVLAETSDYSPDQISMTYWFVRAGEGEIPRPQQLQFSYSTAQHEQIRKELIANLEKLTHWLSRYQQGEMFPQVPMNSALCDGCSFAMRCQRGAFYSGWAEAALPDIAEIQEIAL